MAFLPNLLFPDDISYGSSGGAGFKTTVVQMGSGHETRIPRWEYPLHQFNVAYGVKTQEQVAAVKAVYLAAQGANLGFRFKDFSDFSTGQHDVGTPSDTDVVIGVGDASKTTFQLIKKYTANGYETIRTITKPVAGTVVIAVNGTPVATGWTVNVTTGVVTFTTAPGAAASITAGFEFDVPVRFGEDADRLLSASIDDFSNRSISSITLVEVKESLIVYDPFPYGGSQELSFSADIALSYGVARLWVMEPTASGKSVILPDPASLPTGNLHFAILNVSGSLSFTVKTHLGATVATVAAGNGVESYLSVDGSGNKVWYLR